MGGGGGRVGGAVYHFYSHCKDTSEKDRECLFTSAATNLAFSHLQRLFWSLKLDISYSWNKINALGWFIITLNEKKNNPTHNISSLY